MTSGRSLSSSDSAARSAAFSTGTSSTWSKSAITTGDFASSTMAASSALGRRKETGCGVSRAVALRKQRPGTTTVAVRTTAQPVLPQPHWGMVGPEMEDAERELSDTAATEEE